ncbi:hypothetical protein RND71_021833 [Anisodus tanguticus]|uniref:NAC domain-containing protein n=1 Tax=Anisodus tanguticus TaxID=243964 RepID=A0AAE1VFL8_9SOLA|nr:hypothetical protein RND71_021833 [Anisodus tanguticus]
MSTLPTCGRSIMGKRFHPTDVELINYLKRFLRGESFLSQCPIRLVEIYGDQPPSAIFEEVKVGYFISPLKKRKNSYERYCRTCGNGNWRGQTSEEYKIEQDVAGIIEVVLHEPDDYYCTKEPATISQAEYQLMDEPQNYFEEIDWADDLLIYIDDFGDIICC